jgi:hypothetical protein
LWTHPHPRRLGSAQRLCEPEHHSKAVLTGGRRRGRELVEIAGNDDVLITVLTRDPAEARNIEAAELFAVPMQARPGWRRLGLDVKVSKLLGLMRQIEGTTIELEHVYDY